MTDFIIHFLISNLFISGIIGLLMAVKHLFRNSLSGRMQYHLWFLLLGLLAVPFIPLRSVRFSRIFSRLAFMIQSADLGVLKRKRRLFQVL